ncbi:ABC transporter substrate-binding protein [Bradyrhizobium sp. BR 1433]|uniref:ABC transporter substrate-binding protein n=1 Tax=Bradyrhizobium sp. BR 1433 TaxID=3447967 RepID=UPI003EE602E5
MKRRDVLMGALNLGAVFSMSAPFVVPPRAQAATTITYVGWGGSAGDFFKEFWIRPFTAETGISVEYVIGPDLARVKAQVTTNNVEWDVVELTGPSVYAGAKEGFWEAVDPKIVDSARFVVKQPPFAVPVYIFTSGIAYDPNRTKRPADDFSQLWDVKNFPGRRALPSYHASDVLELALLADGVAPSGLYPLDVDRAFRALDRIKLYVTKWYAETAQAVTLIQTNEADYTYAGTNRVKAAKAAGASIDFSFGQCISGTAYFNVLRGSKRKEAAMRFLEFVTRPAQQASLANKLGVPSVTKGVEQLMEEQARRWMPDLDNPKNVFLDNEYWADHYVELDKRFKEWILT